METDLDIFVKQCVAFLVSIDALATVAFIFAFLLISWVVSTLIKLKEDKDDE